MNTYKMTLEDSVDSMTFDLLEVPIVDKDVEGAVDNTTLDGNIFTDYLWLKKNYVQKWSIMCDDEYSRLRGFYTRQFDNASVPTYKLFYGENISQDQVISGDYILVNNPTERNAQITSFELLGDAEQTTYSGKNLMPLEPYRFGYYYGEAVGNQVNYDVTTYANLVTFTPNADGTSKLAVTASWRGIWFMSQALTAGIYYFDLDGASSTGNMGASVYALDSDHKITRQILNITGNPVTTALKMAITLAEGETYIALGIGVRTTTGTVTMGTFMLSSGSTATDYEPYVGGTASPNPDYPQAVNTVTGEQTVEIEGKNLFDGNYVAYAIGGSGGNLWFTANSSRSAIIPCQPSTTYTVKKNGGNRLNIADAPTMPSDNSTVNVLYSNNSAMEHTITTSATAHYLLVYVSNDSTEPEMQLELGSTATDYEPYQGQEFEVNLGKNLFDKYNLTQRNINYVSSWTNSGGIITINPTGSGALLNLYLSEPLPAGDYILKSDTPLPTETTLRASGGTNGAVLATISGATEQTFTLASPAVCICFIVQGTQSGTPYTIDLSSLIIESGSTFITPIELAKIGNYQDRIYKTDGKWYIEKQVGKVVLDGTETGWASDGGGAPFRLLMPDFLWVSTITILATSDHFESVPYNANWNNYTSLITTNASGSATAFKFRYTAITSLADWKSWLSTHPTTVYYALATPTTTEITNSELVGQLEAILQAYLYTGTNNVSNNAVSPNLAGQMNIGYRLIFSEETVLIEPTAVRLTLTDGGIINVCGCRQNVQLSMRETIQ